MALINFPLQPRLAVGLAFGAHVILLACVITAAAEFNTIPSWLFQPVQWSIAGILVAVSICIASQRSRNQSFPYEYQSIYNSVLRNLLSAVINIVFAYTDVYSVGDDTARHIAYLICMIFISAVNAIELGHRLFNIVLSHAALTLELETASQILTGIVIAQSAAPPNASMTPAPVIAVSEVPPV